MNNKSNPFVLTHNITYIMEVVAFGAAIYFVLANRSAHGAPIPPEGAYSYQQGAPKNNRKIYYSSDTMRETLDKGLNIKSYKNSIYVQHGDPHYFDTSRRESAKNINNLADLYNDYVQQIDKKDQLVGHVVKKGQLYFGAPDRSNTTGSLPYFIVPFLPRKVDGPLSTNPISMHMKI